MLTALPALLSAIVLIAGGVAFLAAGFLLRKEALEYRVALVQPRMLAVTQAAEWQPGTLPGQTLFRMPTSGLEEPELRAVVRLLSRLGLPAGWAPLSLIGVRILGSAGLGLVALYWASRLPASSASGLIPLSAMAAAAVMGWFLPIIIIRRNLKQRTKLVSTGLPDALELLVVCVEAGLSLEDGLDRVVSELARSQPALAEELALTSADLKILPSRDQALANFAKRVDIPSVRSVITTLSQTLRYGTPLAQSLRVVAAEMRNDSLIHLEEQANRLPALLTLPVILFLMPTIFLIVGGPAALRLMDSFIR